VSVRDQPKRVQTHVQPRVAVAVAVAGGTHEHPLAVCEPLLVALDPLPDELELPRGGGSGSGTGSGGGNGTGGGRLGAGQRGPQRGGVTVGRLRSHFNPHFSSHHIV
jgi:hypothetical protein